MTDQPDVVVLTGAGISAESGINTFRDAQGLWENYRFEDVATPEAFASNPSLVYCFYNERRLQLQSGEVQPNAAHYALVRLEQLLGRRMLLVTQNVDDLHERAGSERVVHMHGSLLSARCTQCGKSHDWEGSFDSGTPCPCCTPFGRLRPDIVWFGEMPLHMERIISALSSADIFVAIGTSGQVYPAAGFVQLAQEAGARTIELNLQQDVRRGLFSESHQGPASVVVPKFVDEIIQSVHKK